MAFSFREFLEQAATGPAGPVTTPPNDKPKPNTNPWKYPDEKYGGNPSSKGVTNFKRPPSPMSPGTKQLWPPPASPFTFDFSKTSKTYDFFLKSKMGQAKGQAPAQNPAQK